MTGRLVYNSRGSKTIEVDVISDNKHLGRVCAPSGASVGKYEAQNFPIKGPEESLRILAKKSNEFIGLNSDDLRSIHEVIQKIDTSNNYDVIGGAVAFAVTIASMDSAAKSLGIPLFQLLSDRTNIKPCFPFPLGNVLGGGAHAGPGTPDIQEILVTATGAKSIQEAIITNLSVHKELHNVLLQADPNFTNGRGDEGGWAPKIDNHKALELAAKACENLGYTLGKQVSLGVDFASSTQWDPKKMVYRYNRANFENGIKEQIEFVSDIIAKYKLIYAEDAVHEEAFEDMAEITARFPKTLVTGDDLTVTSKTILQKAINHRSCNAAILKVNQAGSLFDALEFANLANKNNIKLVTSHRSGESTDSQISHIGIATGSKMLKVGIVGGERVAKLNELLRLSEHDLICGMVKI